MWCFIRIVFMWWLFQLIMTQIKKQKILYAKVYQMVNSMCCLRNKFVNWQKISSNQLSSQGELGRFHTDIAINGTLKVITFYPYY